MKLIEFTHAQTGQVAQILSNQIFGFTYSDVYKCIIIYSVAGAIFPVKGTEDEIKAKLLDGGTHE